MSEKKSDEKENQEAQATGSEPEGQGVEEEAVAAQEETPKGAGKEAAKEEAPPETRKKKEEPRHSYEELSGKTVAQLREIAKEVEHEAVRGYSSMHKEELLTALCTAFGIETHVHHEVVGIDKGAIKSKIRSLKAERDKALEAGDRRQLKIVRRRIHRLKRKLRAATV